MLRFFSFIIDKAFLLILGIIFGSCGKGNNDILFLRDLFLDNAASISPALTGAEKNFDAEGNVIREVYVDKNLSKGHILLINLKRDLEAYKKITKHPISQSLVEEIQEILSELKEHVDNLPDSGDGAKFAKEYKSLTDYIYVLRPKDVS